MENRVIELMNYKESYTGPTYPHPLEPSTHCTRTLGQGRATSYHQPKGHLSRRIDRNLYKYIGPAKLNTIDPPLAYVQHYRVHVHSAFSRILFWAWFD